jgi:hypothetical protein
MQSAKRWLTAAAGVVFLGLAFSLTGASQAMADKIIQVFVTGGTVGIDQTTAGANGVTVKNFPATQPVSGNVGISPGANSVTVASDATHFTHLRTVASNLVTEVAISQNSTQSPFFRYQADGTLDPNNSNTTGYSPPAGQDLIVMDIQWDVLGPAGTTGAFNFEYVFNGGTQAIDESFVVVPLVGNGLAAGTVQFPAGFVVTSGNYLRIVPFTQSPSNTFVTCHGYLVPHQ